MTSTITVSPGALTVSTTERVEIAPGASNAATGIDRVVPAFIRADEAYYWSFHWQQDVRESMRELGAGEYEEFDSDDPNDVVRWMLDLDDAC